MFQSNTGEHILRRTRNELIYRFVAISAMMGIVSVGLTWQAITTGISAYYLVVLACVVIVISVSLDVLDMVLAISDDLAAHRTATVTGRVQTSATTDRAVDLLASQRSIILDDKSFHISRAQANALHVGDYHRIAYAPKSRIVLTVER